MTSEEIRQHLRPFLGSDVISDDQLHRTADYLELLLKWNAKINLTAVRTPTEIVTRHFGESFFAARHLLSRDNQPASAIDIGSGAGFPGLPMKVWLPSVRLTLIESNGRKATFLREVVRSLGLLEVEVVPKRAENVEAQADLVTLRAVEHFESVLPVASRLLNSGGTLALLIGAAQEQVARAKLSQLQWKESIPIPLSKSRVLLIGCSA